MYAQNFSPRLNLITTTVLFLTSTTSFHGQEAVELKYSECFSPFKCGENIQNIRYPFWGENRPSYCGLKGFELKCHNNNYATIDIGTDLDFHLLDIDQSTREIRIVSDDIGEDDANICLPIGSYTIPNKTVLGYNFATELIYLFYDCPPSLDVELPFGSAWDNFTCLKGGARSNGFYVDESSWTPDDSRMFNECKTEMVVPVLRTAFQELRNNVSMTMVELFKQGFVLDYIIDAVACSACVNSSGLCGSDYEDSGKFQCICRDRAYPYLCPNGEIRKGALPMKIGIGFGAALTGILLICFIYYIRKLPNTSLKFFRRKTKNDRDVEAFIMQYGSSITKRYTYYDVRKITNSFKYELGKGGYGNVFKGKLPDGRVVAVKVLNVSKGKGEEFINEVASIGRTSHINVVTLLGFCYEGRKRALIYEFMPNGSLEKFIYGKISATTSQNLGRKKLYDIALGIARGLEYLHCGCNTRILHLDIKPHNILLDEDFSPKISDFGLAKLYTRKESIISTIEARGTIGYIAPEVFSRNFGGVSHKSDVYSYGMMILEMVGGRKNVDAGVIRTSEIYFPHWIYKRIELDEELDLVTEMTVEENEVARKMVIVGLWCIQTDPSQRPSITKVIEMLEGSISALEIPPKPYLCSPRRSASNSSTKEVLNSPPGSDFNSFNT